jgi:hypothetical protein
MPLADWMQHCTAARVLSDWQTLIAGVLALLAALWTIRQTVKSADREIAASQKQMDTTVRLERRRAASEGYAFHAMLLATMKRVLKEADEAKELVYGCGPTDGPSVEDYEARTHLTKLGFTELRAACVRYGGRLTEEFLELETKIDNFASKTKQTSDHRRVGKHAGLEDELADIEARVAHLQEEAAAEMKNANAVIDATET